MKMEIQRNIREIVLSDLKEKMVFLAGPRQCGKTTLAQDILKVIKGTYYNWDITTDRKLLRQNKLEEKSLLWAFDEIHKNRSWRNWLKGVYDFHHKKHSILVTGSAKLEVYNRGGDSLQGRYLLHHLHPFTLSELVKNKSNYNLNEIFEMAQKVNYKESQETLLSLMRFGSFPEPFLGSSEKKAARWRINYVDRLIREEVSSLQNLRDLDKLELLYDHLPNIVGSILSINSLKEDLEVAFETVKHWISILENIYGIFRLSPYGPPKIKAVKKEQKLYLWDWGNVDDDGARFENLIAFHLLRFCHWCQDIEGEKVELHFFRDIRGMNEVDFILTRKRKPWVAIEVKTNDRPISKGLKYLLNRTKFSYGFQLNLNGKDDYVSADINNCKIRSMPASIFLNNLP